MMEKFIEQTVSQLLALATFFIFPAFQYLTLRYFAKSHGNPELWYLPAYGFRIVIRNIPKKKQFSDLKTRTQLRNIIPRSEGASIHTLLDTTIGEQDAFFLFPDTEHTIICFRIEKSQRDGIQLIITDKIGEEKSRIASSDFYKIMCDYSANLKNFFNFDVKISKRVELKSSSLESIFLAVQKNDSEQQFPFDRIRSI